jgi:hypothetical protein
MNIKLLKQVCNIVIEEYPENDERAQKAVLALASLDNPWQSVKQPPPLVYDENVYPQKQSVDVLGQDKFGKMRVVRFEQIYNPAIGETGPLGIYMTCKDGWNVTDRILYWQYLPAPKQV